MLKAYTYKLKPNKHQQKQLNTAFGACRFVYNYALDLRIKKYKEDKSFVSDGDLYKEITRLKNYVDFDEDKDYTWLNDVPAQCIMHTIRNVSTAFKNFTKNQYGFPKFKKKGKSRDSFMLDKAHQGIAIDFINRKVHLQKYGWIHFHPNREFDLTTHEIRRITVSRDCRGTYMISVLVDNHQVVDTKAKVCLDGSSIGIDLGVAHFYTDSEGHKVENPRFIERNLDKLKVLNRHFSRQKKQSNRWYKTKKKISALHLKIHNQRMDFLHKESKKLVDKYDTICMEDLDVKSLMQTKGIARSLSSAGLGMFGVMLSYKTEWRGKNLLKVDQYFPSSKLCHCCGYKNDSLKLSDREWTCPSCGETHDRDLNAAINIRLKAINTYHAEHTNPAGSSGLRNAEEEVTNPMMRLCV